MGILIVLLPLLIVMGAFMWLRPSRSDQRLAQLRNTAINQGFRLGSLKVSDTSEEGRVRGKKSIVTLYQLSVELIKDDRLFLTVLRSSGESGAYLPEGWVWDHREGMTEHQYEQLHSLLASLPENVRVFNVSQGLIGLSWDELDPNPEYDQFKLWLTELASLCGKKILS